MMPASITTPPRRFRFGLRSLFVLVTVAAVASSWVVRSHQWISQRRQYASQASGSFDVELTNGELVSYDLVYELANGEIAYEPAKGQSSITPPPWSLALFGEPGVRRIEVYTEDDEAECRRLFPEAEVTYNH